MEITREQPLDTGDYESNISSILEANKLRSKENILFKSYVARHFGDNIPEEVGAEIDGDEAVELHQKLLFSKRAELAQKEKQLLKEELDLLNLTAEKDIDALKAVLEESRQRVQEIKKAAYEFRRDMVSGQDPGQPSKVSSERLMDHWMEHNSAKQLQIEKLKAKNIALKTQIAKIDSKLRSKDQQGGGLHTIDLEQLKIENSQYNQKIKDRNKELLKLKMTTGKTVQVLNDAKRDLSVLIAQQKELKLSQSERDESTRRVELEMEKTEGESQLERARNRQLQNAANQGIENLQILDYVEQKARLHELTGSLKNWGRKVEIAEVGATRGKRSLKLYKTWKETGEVPDEL